MGCSGDIVGRYQTSPGGARRQYYGGDTTRTPLRRLGKRDGRRDHRMIFRSLSCSNSPPFACVRARTYANGGAG